MQKLTSGEREYRGLVHVARQLEFFKSLTGAQFETLLAHIQLYAFDSGETLFRDGDPPNAFYILHEGTVRIEIGRRFFGLLKRTIRLGPGAMFGEIALLEKRPHKGTAVAIAPLKVFVMLQDDFNKLLKLDVDFAERIRFLASQRKFERTT